MEMRRKDREVTDLAQIELILENAKILHLGLSDEEGLYVVPLHYGYLLENGTLTLYMHGANAGRKYRAAAEGCPAFVEIDTGATLLPGEEVACDYSASYCSVMGPGRLSLVSDPAEKMGALAILMKTQTGRDFAISPKTAASVAVFKVVLDSFTAKSKPMPGAQKAPETPTPETPTVPFSEMDNQELFCVLTGDRGVIAQAELHRVLNLYRAKHHELNKDLATMVREILAEDAE